MDPRISRIMHVVYESLLQYKYIGIFVLMMIFPSESIMPLAGHLAHSGQASLAGVILAGTAGSTLGSVFVYAIAWFVGQEATNKLIERYGKWIGLTVKQTERAGKWFDRHADKTVFFGRFVPGVRTAVSIPAGIRHMPFARFLAYTAVGSGIWISIITTVGYAAFSEVPRLQKAGQYATAAVIVILLGLFVAWRLSRRKE